MTTTAIELEDVHLCYRLAKQRVASFKEHALHWIRGSLSYEDLWALRGISLRLERGEAVGIIGRNGAGKSSLLRVISRVLRPTRGSVTVSGSIAPLLELGVGFDYELTGRENIFLSALLLGRSRREVVERSERIIDFSELAPFMDVPVRNYSSGMLARLSFSILTAWKPDILILDEFLGVGDAGFVTKCHQRIEGFLAGGTTLLFVSHNAEDIRQRCHRVVWLDAGNILADGPAKDVLARYTDGIGAETIVHGEFVPPPQDSTPDAAEGPAGGDERARVDVA